MYYKEESLRNTFQHSTIAPDLKFEVFYVCKPRHYCAVAHCTSDTSFTIIRLGNLNNPSGVLQAISSDTTQHEHFLPEIRPEVGHSATTRL